MDLLSGSPGRALTLAGARPGEPERRLSAISEVTERGTRNTDDGHGHVHESPSVAVHVAVLRFPRDPVERQLDSAPEKCESRDEYPVSAKAKSSRHRGNGVCLTLAPGSPILGYVSK